MSLKQVRILVVDDEQSVTDLLYEDLASEGYNCVAVATGEDALMKLPNYRADVVLLDLRLPGVSGMDVLREIKSTCPRTAVIVITGAEDIETAVEAMKTGAVDYITKPFELETINDSIEAVLKTMMVQDSRPTPKEAGAETRDEEVDWARCLDDIAIGVKTRLDWLTGHVMTQTLIERTIAIARSLDIPENLIEKWADTERKHIEWVGVFASTLEKVDRSPIA